MARKLDFFFLKSIPINPKTLFVVYLIYIASTSSLQAAKASLADCGLSKIPLIHLISNCRPLSNKESKSLQHYWAKEDSESLCHYFYFPIADPTASKALLLENYLIMKTEMTKRKVNCKADFPHQKWIQGTSMLEKLQKQAPSEVSRFIEKRKESLDKDPVTDSYKPG